MVGTYENYEFYRNQKGLSDYQISKGSGISRGIISDWKNGRHHPHNKTLKKIADYLGITVNDFYQSPQQHMKPATYELYNKTISTLELNDKESYDAASLKRLIKAYVFVLNSGEKVDLTLEEYQELQKAIDIYVDSWIRNKKNMR